MNYLQLFCLTVQYGWVYSKRSYECYFQTPTKSEEYFLLKNQLRVTREIWQYFLRTCKEHHEAVERVNWILYHRDLHGRGERHHPDVYEECIRLHQGYFNAKWDPLALPELSPQDIELYNQTDAGKFILRLWFECRQMSWITFNMRSCVGRDYFWLTDLLEEENTELVDQIPSLKDYVSAIQDCNRFLHYSREDLADQLRTCDISPINGMDSVSDIASVRESLTIEMSKLDHHNFVLDHMNGDVLVDYIQPAAEFTWELLLNMPF